MFVNVVRGRVPRYMASLGRCMLYPYLQHTAHHMKVITNHGLLHSRLCLYRAEERREWTRRSLLRSWGPHKAGRLRRGAGDG